jgi:hypothetical protein
MRNRGLQLKRVVNLGEVRKATLRALHRAKYSDWLTSGADIGSSIVPPHTFYMDNEKKYQSHVQSMKSKPA